VAAAIRERHATDVDTKATLRPGEFSVLVDGRRVISKMLPLIRPSDEKVLAAVARALA